VHGTARDAGIIHGLPESFIDGVTFENCSIAADHGLDIAHARNVDTAGLAVTVKEGEPIKRL
jgi:hypothetical protein